MKDAFNNVSCSSTGSIPCGSTQHLGQGSTTDHGVSNDLVKFFLAQELAYGNALVGSEAGKRNHGGVTVTADNGSFDVVQAGIAESH